MKKIVGTIAAIALATSAVFADVNVGMGFSRAIWTPFAYDGNDARMDISTSWGVQPRIGASISGASDECGVVADMKFDGGNVAVNDNAYVWVKPISWLKINIGQSFDGTLRGNACYGMWDWLRVGGSTLDISTGELATATTVDTDKVGLVNVMTGEDFIFTRVCMNPLGGAYLPLVGTILMADPIDGLHIAVGLPIDGYNNQKIEDVFKNIQVQAGYTIDGVGTIKAQYIGSKGTGTPGDAKEDDWAQIEAAFDLKAVEDMTLSVGAKFRTYEDAPIDVAAYWSMPFDALRVHASVGLTIAPKFMGGDDSLTTLVAGAGIDYDLGNGLAVSADVRFGKMFCSADGFDDSIAADPAIAFGAWVNKGIANGTLGIGAQGAIRQTIRDFTPSAYDDFSFAIPVRVQCFF
ncbi:hypothetical protein [Treponema sp.]|uniref:hypothetical protein n=1 Tax=Treponema sp. TaxID=166 RepID=UPI00389030A8